MVQRGDGFSALRQTQAAPCRIPLVRFALRSMFLSTNLVTRPESVKCRCQRNWHPTHFLTCEWESRARTSRHHHVRSALTRFIRKAGCVAREEKEVGTRFKHDGEPADIIAVIVTVTDNTRLLIDVGITTAAVTTRHIARSGWPTEDEVEAATTKDDKDALVADTSRPIWRQRRHPNIAVRQMSKFRELALRGTLDKIVGSMHDAKVAKYRQGQHSVLPFILTAQGYMTRDSSDFVQNLCCQTDYALNT